MIEYIKLYHYYNMKLTINVNYTAGIRKESVYGYMRGNVLE